MSKSNPIPVDKAFELCKKHRDNVKFVSLVNVGAVLDIQKKRQVKCASTIL